jgi:hypothetical protein
VVLGNVINSGGISTSVEVVANFGEFAISLNDFAGVTGWQLKPEGLCFAKTCVPVTNSSALTNSTHIDLVEFARVTNQNIVVDQKHKIAALGERADSRSEAMATLVAPDFRLPDIHGKQVSFSDFNRRKRLLLAWSSW